MLRNYITIAWRNLVRNKTFSGINILGLALGLACSLLIGLWIQDELSVGRQHPNSDNLYRVYQRLNQNGTVSAGEGTPGMLATELKQQFPEVVYAASFSWEEPHIVTINNKIEKQTIRYVGADWFRLYGIPVLAGSSASALDVPNSVAISRKVAETYFGDAQAAINQPIRFDNNTDYQVTAVYEDLPANAEARYDFLLSWSQFMTQKDWAKEWGNSPVQTRIQLRADTDPVAFEAKIKSQLKKHNVGNSASFDVQLFLYPERDAYLYSNFENGYPNGGRIDYVQLFGIVAIFVLLIACINFMNLATARSAKRAREVGVRKVVGAKRGALIGQFIGEALLLTFLGLALAIGLAALVLPAFNQLTNKQIILPASNPIFWAMLLGLGLVVGVIAGSYPALFLSSLSPVRVLRNSLRFGAGAQVFRQGLVIVQFALSMLLIVGTVVVYRQLNYMQTKNLGYERENLLYVMAEGELVPKYETFKQELLRMLGIQSVARMQSPLLGFANMSTFGISWPGKDPNSNPNFMIQSGGYDLIKTLKMSVKGRDFSPTFGTDSSNYIINETAAKIIGYSDPLGKPLTQWDRPGTIIGVVNDFHYGSLHKPIEPLVIRLGKLYPYETILIRTQPGQTKTALASLENVYQKFNPKIPFSYQFADSEYQKLYKSEMIIGTLANVFAGLAILIASLGLFGLAAFMAEQRTKEIGVRKVLGASVTSVVTLLSKDFLKLVLIAIVLATPLAWYAAQQWLQNFEYRIELAWWMFGLAGLVAVVIALLTVSFQSVKAALMNPVKSLRTE
ncbi:ABC transporter permease [Spirosoma soli]|uniref:ABC transporter permease n=1 Tax=Spirosoma soli TaxID=1770529 RepID=A0ABW5M1W2_9BACT